MPEKRTLLKRVHEAWGDLPLECINPGLALAFLQGECHTRSGHAANKARKNLAAAWHYGQKYMDHFPTMANPFLAVDKFPETRHPRYVPPEADFWRVLDVAQGQDWVLLLTFLHTGARRGEIFRLQWVDVDFGRQQIRLCTRKRRDGSLEADWIPMNDELSQALLLHRQAAVNAWVFTQQEGRYRNQPYQEYRGFPQQLCRQAGVTPFGCHSLRHLTASLLAQHNTPMVGIQQILRHRKASTTELYVRRLESVRPYLRMLEGGVFQRGTHNGTHTKEEGLRAITS